VNFRLLEPAATAALPKRPRALRPVGFNRNFRYRNRGTKYLRKYGMKWTYGSAERQRGRALSPGTGRVPGGRASARRSAPARSGASTLDHPGSPRSRAGSRRAGSLECLNSSESLHLDYNLDEYSREPGRPGAVGRARVGGRPARPARARWARPAVGREVIFLQAAQFQ
jgi:hypothetical protein